jgi:hypothetical protein
VLPFLTLLAKNLFQKSGLNRIFVMPLTAIFFGNAIQSLLYMLPTT